MADDAIRPYEPQDLPTEVADGLWVVDGPVVRMAYAGGSVPFPTRMTIVRLQDGGLWLHSPTEPSPALVERVAALGPVRHLVSPNKIHYAWIGSWKALFPLATAWASPGVRERAASQRIPVSFDRDLGGKAEPEWSADLDQLHFVGSRFMDEVVFFHRSSRTVILADLIENFEPERVQGGLYRTLLRLSGAAHPDGKAPLDLRFTFLGHFDQARACRDRLLAWGAERVILAHGRWYEKDGQAELERAFRWLDGLTPWG